MQRFDSIAIFFFLLQMGWSGIFLLIPRITILIYHWHNQRGQVNATLYKWRKEYDGSQIDQAKRYRELEEENRRLHKVVADLRIDNSTLIEATTDSKQ